MSYVVYLSCGDNMRVNERALDDLEIGQKGFCKDHGIVVISNWIRELEK